MSSVDTSSLHMALNSFARDHYGPDAIVGGVDPMVGGHAGLTFGFEIRRESNGTTLANLVLRLAPAGVKRQGNTDVYRQAPLLKALHRAGLPVPLVPWSSPNEDQFGAPFIMMERLKGLTFFVWDPDQSFDRSNEAVASLWRKCASALAAFHNFDWQAGLPNWEEPRALVEELLRWDKILEKSPDPECVRLGRQIRQKLLDSMPEGGPIGLVHGDFQPGNTLYDHGEVTGVIDWELASIGHQTLDLGWIMMLADEANWNDDWKVCAPITPADLREVYEAQLGRKVANVNWYRALAGYRLGAIAGINVHLHRTGRRHDPVWEHFARAAPKLFGRAEELLAERQIA